MFNATMCLLCTYLTKCTLSLFFCFSFTILLILVTFSFSKTTQTTTFGLQIRNTWVYSGAGLSPKCVFDERFTDNDVKKDKCKMLHNILTCLCYLSLWMLGLRMAYIMTLAKKSEHELIFIFMFHGGSENEGKPCTINCFIGAWTYSSEYPNSGTRFRNKIL